MVDGYSTYEIGAEFWIYSLNSWVCVYIGQDDTVLCSGGGQEVVQEIDIVACSEWEVGICWYDII